MSAYSELFPGRKLKHEGGHSTPGRQHDPGGPLDLDGGVVFLAPPKADNPHSSHSESAELDTGSNSEDTAPDREDEDQT